MVPVYALKVFIAHHYFQNLYIISVSEDVMACIHVPNEICGCLICIGL